MKLKWKPDGVFYKKLDQEASEMGIEVPFEDYENKKDINLLFYLICNFENQMENQSNF